MKVILENVESHYMGVIHELAEVLRFRVAKVENESKRVEIDRRIERYEANQSKLIRPDWQKITDEAQSAS
jgi:hypothetical protein